MKNGDMPAAPIFDGQASPQHHSSVLVREGQVAGLTKRELIAAMAMQGIRATMTNSHANYADVAMAAVAQADALLAALERTA